jgi:hypothetical protein
MTEILCGFPQSVLVNAALNYLMTTSVSFTIYYSLIILSFDAI